MIAAAELALVTAEHLVDKLDDAARRPAALVQRAHAAICRRHLWDAARSARAGRAPDLSHEALDVFGEDEA